MGNLRRLTLSHDKRSDAWKLTEDGSNRTVRVFETKEEATAGGVLPKALGSQGGSVKITKLDGTYQEERTFPRKADPRESKG